MFLVYLSYCRSRAELRGGKMSKYSNSSHRKNVYAYLMFLVGAKLNIFPLWIRRKRMTEYIIVTIRRWSGILFFSTYNSIEYSFDKLYFFILVPFPCRSRDMPSSDRDSVFSHITVVERKTIIYFQMMHIILIVLERTRYIFWICDYAFIVWVSEHSCNIWRNCISRKWVDTLHIFRILSST